MAIDNILEYRKIERSMKIHFFAPSFLLYILIRIVRRKSEFRELFSKESI